jgi:hypothetical protein
MQGIAGFRQRGFALLILIALLAVAAAYVLLSRLDAVGARWSQGTVTQRALAEAKAGLIAYAVSVPLTTSGSKRPGDLPCPDLDNDGSADGPCSTPASRFGRLPWKTLGLPDLRDSSGERLWYAVSTNFKNNPRTGILNSDTKGTILVRNSNSVILNDPAAGTGAIAVIIAPGAPLTRQGTSGEQQRGCKRGGSDDTLCATHETCGTPNPVATDKCNAANYLDTLSGTEDNVDFAETNPVDGFIDGEIRDIANTVIVNDRLLSITYDQLMPLIEKRVAEEALACLKAYAQNSGGRYPWAARLDPGPTPDYNDDADERFGRMPDTFGATTASDPTMKGVWVGGECNIGVSGWWPANNWKEFVFYSVADAFKPGAPLPPACGSCLAVDPPSPHLDKQVVVIVSGERLGAHSRTDKGKLDDYLEGKNAGAVPNLFEQQPRSGTFNDSVVFLPRP